MKRLIIVVLAVAAAMFSSTGIARADLLSVRVCMVLDDYPSTSGVIGVVDALVDEGYTAYQAGRIVGEAVRDVCPEHMDLVMRVASALV